MTKQNGIWCQNQRRSQDDGGLGSNNHKVKGAQSQEDQEDQEDHDQEGPGTNNTRRLSGSQHKRAMEPIARPKKPKSKETKQPIFKKAMDPMTKAAKKSIIAKESNNQECQGLHNEEAHD